MHRDPGRLVDHNPTGPLCENAEWKLGLGLGTEERLGRKGRHLDLEARANRLALRRRWASRDPHGSAREEPPRRRTREAELAREVGVETLTRVLFAHDERAGGAEGRGGGHAAAYPGASAWGKV